MKKLQSTTRLLKLALPQIRPIGFGFLALMIASAVNLYLPHLLRQTINNQLPSFLGGWGIGLFLMLLSLLAIQAVAFYARSMLFSVAGNHIVTNLRKRLFSSIIGNDMSFFDSARSGDLTSRLNADTQLLQTAVSVNLSVMARYSLQVIAGVVLMASISARLTVALSVAILALIGVSSLLVRQLKRASKHLQAMLGQTNNVAEECVGAARTIKAFTYENHAAARYASCADQSYAASIARTKIASFFSSFASFLMNAAILVVLWYGISLTKNGSLSLGDLSGFLLYGVIVAVSFGFLTGAITEHFQALGAAERIFELLDQPRVIAVPSAPVKLATRSQSSVKFSAVEFAYPSRPQAKVLKDVTFELGAGETLALVGESGAGKSTIISLMLRLYDPQKGLITFDGVDLRNLDPHDLRSKIALVPQEPEMFAMSVADNLRLGQPEATQAELEQACARANILDFIENLPQKFDTMLGERGLNVSGGQKQRLAIARAILRNPSLLLLDEATSALDSENEFQVQQALREVMRDRSTLIIAHRLATVRRAQRVLVLQDGNIVQSGTHDSLTHEPGLYKQLVDYQKLSA